MQHNMKLYTETYDKHKNLKLAAKELGMKWQTLYWHLTSIGHPVTGDKERYGSNTDKLARYTEKLFQKSFPYAVDNNEEKFQSSLDFTVKGLDIDIKSATKKDGYKSNPNKNAAYRWAFSCKVQEKVTDYLICYCFSGEDCVDHGTVEKILLIPKEFFANKQSFSVSCTRSKWYDFEVTETELKEFFDSM